MLGGMKRGSSGTSLAVAQSGGAIDVVGWQGVSASAT
jgi:hypothetical protein